MGFQAELGLRAAAAALRVPADRWQTRARAQPAQPQVPLAHQAVAAAAAAARQPHRAAYRAQSGISDERGPGVRDRDQLRPAERVPSLESSENVGPWSA